MRLDNYLSDQIVKFHRSDSTLERNMYPDSWPLFSKLFDSNESNFSFLCLLFDRLPWARSSDMIYSVIRSRLTESVIRLWNQLNWELLSAGPHPMHNVVNSFLKNYSYFYTKVIYILPSFIRLRFHEIFKKRSFNKLKHKNLWKCRSRKLECFLTKNVNPLHCCEIHCLLSSQNKQPVSN